MNELGDGKGIRVRAFDAWGQQLDTSSYDRATIKVCTTIYECDELAEEGQMRTFNGPQIIAELYYSYSLVDEIVCDELRITETCIEGYARGKLVLIVEPKQPSEITSDSAADQDGTA